MITHADHDTSKGPKNPLWARIFQVSSTHHGPSDLGAICSCSVRKRKIRNEDLRI